MDPAPMTWVHLAILQVVGEQDLAVERLEEGLTLHSAIADQAAAHLNLVGDNTFRTPWLAAKLLSSDKNLAKASAASLATHLATTRPGNRTAFEEHLFTKDNLRTCIEDFSHEEPAALLWHADGKYECLFKFLAPRFLLAPDHVLDAERVHARWQWACHQSRSNKMPNLNATLRLKHYMENNQSMPSTEELLPHLKAEAQEHRAAVRAVDDDVALGMRSAWVYRHRFNLVGPAGDIVGLGGPAPVAPAPVAPAGGPWALAWRNYIKSVFTKGYMYKVSCNPSIALHVAENKTLAGREERAYEGEALGRKVAFVMFEAMPGGGGLVRRVHRDSDGVQQLLMSIAEVLQTLRPLAVPVDPGRAPAQTELLLEALYEHLEILRFSRTVEHAAGEMHVYSLGEEVNAEIALVCEVPEEQRTKMMLARCLQRNDLLLPGESLQNAWGLQHRVLAARAAHLLPAAPVAAPAPVAPAAPAAPAAGARGRGRGRGRGRAPAGRGRGRG